MQLIIMKNSEGTHRTLSCIMNLALNTIWWSWIYELWCPIVVNAMSPQFGRATLVGMDAE